MSFKRFVSGQGIIMSNLLALQKKKPLAEGDAQEANAKSDVNIAVAQGCHSRWEGNQVPNSKLRKLKTYEEHVDQ